MKPPKLRIALVGLALASAPLAVGAVSAQTGQTSPAAAAADYTGVFLGKLASALGVSQAKLTAGLKQAGTATIDQALKNQDITRDQATRMRQDVQDGRMGFLGGRGLRGGPGGDRGFGRGFGPGPGRGMVGGPATLDAAAKALGLTSDALVTQLRGGKTLSEVAQARGVSLQTVKNAMLAALKTRLNADVTAGRLTRAQADQLLADAGQAPDFGLRGGFGGPRGGFGGRR